jgi:hypothetical protein
MKNNYLENWNIKGKILAQKFLFLFLFLSVFSCKNDASVLPAEDDFPTDIEATDVDETIVVGNATGKKITAWLTGLNTVYSHEDMRTWQDGKKLNKLKKTGVSALRYPEGHQLSFWDWEFPYHEAYQDFWKPDYEQSLSESDRIALKDKNKNRMLVDDYFEICKEGNIEPVMGINMFQGWMYDRNQESIEKAVRLVEYCLEKDPSITYFFLDNESGHQQNAVPLKHIPIEDYIDLIPAYSQAIKAVHPGAKLIPNIMQWNLVEKMIRETGQYWDVYDQHWYYGSKDTWAYFNLFDWRQEVESEKNAERLVDFKKWKEQYNMNHLEIGYLEWNAPPSGLSDDSNPSSISYSLMGLIQADMLMWFAKNDIYMATAWPLMWQVPGKETNLNQYNRNMLDRDDSNWLSPSATIFQAFSYVQKGEILENNNNPKSGLRVLSVKRYENMGYAVLILNKSTNDQTIELVLPEGVKNVTESKHFSEGDGPYKVEIKTLSPELNGNKIILNLEDTSFTYLLVQ